MDKQAFYEHTKEELSQVDDKHKSEFDEEYHQATEELINVIIESLRDDYRSDVEPFEVYANKVRFSLIRNIKDFSNRFRRGHNLLLEELKKG